jgi:hypothetical protein
MQLVQWGCQNTRIVSVIFLVVVCWRVEVINFCQNLIQRSIALGNPAEVGPYRRPKYLIPETPVKPVFSVPYHYRRFLCFIALLGPYKRFLTFQFSGIKKTKTSDFLNPHEASVFSTPAL